MAKGGLVFLFALLASLRMLQQCFMAPSTPTSTPSSFGVPAKGDVEGDFAGGSLLAGPEVPSLEGAREVNVAMFNKKRTKRDRSEGWTKRKKFRTCSLLARAATRSGKKILKRRMWRGKHELAPGDYCNYKMRKVKSLR
ncbi:unnamed protein product [Effrenium voratum]|nr:unnamed protein product [Effrenium voratum]|mmetsp:Transcript_50228/g.119914  ORF Transcript_50228/g.119914 Transcript_50228/m.119914 type:complete len:139 (+) Transcript_50228:83-499(+)|eukprot:CAMPEP_0181453992 /NCGR_PEP_ID=MMETSP1110-20121109/30009_1 /TAXON_ID=174948 /ORGANISM="Symbiodinium sp., Strain CCMP421" /LENGTH=138 /DNA_ID=CAMNT_0023578325 /DNA_START=76 /DNA_END=492 /DNA_ORIENTATION=-